LKYFNSDGSKKDNISINKLSSNEYMEFIRENHIINQKKIKQHKNRITDTFIKNQNADNRLYYFSFIFKNKKYYKLGITSQTLKKRYGVDYAKINRILYDEKIDSAMKIEKELKEKYRDDVFPLKFFNDNSGHTEIFDKDILDLDE